MWLNVIFGMATLKAIWSRHELWMFANGKSIVTHSAVYSKYDLVPYILSAWIPVYEHWRVTTALTRPVVILQLLRRNSGRSLTRLYSTVCPDATLLSLPQVPLYIPYCSILALATWFKIDFDVSGCWARCAASWGEKLLRPFNINVAFNNCRQQLLFASFVEYLSLPLLLK